MNHSTNTPNNTHSIKLSALNWAAMIMLLIALPACQKCLTCELHVTDSNGQMETRPYDDQCGNKVQLDMVRQGCEDAAKLVGGTCVCTKGN